jgi:dTMP kinase
MLLRFSLFLYKLRGMNVLKNFIVFEGLDGAGTTTQCKLLADKVANSIFTFEPTAGVIGTMIRKVLKKEIALDPKTLPYLFATDRAEHIYGKNGVIENAKEKIVICDRYIFSSIAYQALDNDIELILKLNEDFPMPELVFFLNTTVSECQRRINSRGGDKEIFDDRVVQEKILEGYLKAFKYFENKTKIITLNGDLPVEELLKKEFEYLEALK